LQFVVAAYRARLAGEEKEAARAFDDAAQHLRETEPEYSTYVDTMLALRSINRAEARQI
jgi:DNA polymerase/3'-5' exonuclease PolX